MGAALQACVGLLRRPYTPAPLPRIPGDDERAPLEPLATPPALPAAPLAPTGSGPSRGAASYASTYDTAVACLPCMRHHVNTAASAAAAADAAARSGDQAGAKTAVVQSVGELVQFTQWDLTDAKLSHTKPEDAQIILNALPSLDAAVAGLPLPPDPILRAYAGVKEAHRFASSEEPAPEDGREIADRLRPALRWIDEAERITIAPETLAGMAPEQREAARSALSHLREARHALVPEVGTGSSPEALEVASQRLLAAAVTMMPDVPAEMTATMRARAEAAVDTIDDALLARLERGAHSANQGAGR